MAEVDKDDDVIHLASFNVHRSQGSRAGQKLLITISDDSDEEPVTLVPGSPVLVSDDDDVSILEFPTRARKPVIRAAKWGGASHLNGETSTSSAAASAGGPSSPFSASRDATPIQAAAHTPRTHTPPQLGPSSHTPLEAELWGSSSGLTKVEIHVDPWRTIQSAKTKATSLAPPQPSTSGLSNQQAGSVASNAAPQTCAPHSVNAQENQRTSRQAAGGAEASTSAAPLPVSQAPPPKVVIPLHLGVLPPAALQRRPPPPLRTSAQFKTQGNLVQVEPQPLAQAPAQPVVQHAQAAGPHPAVLIAAAPERLGPPEAGHRIILGSQATGEAVPDPPVQPGASTAAPPAHSVRPSYLNSYHPAPPASLPHNGGEAGLVPAPGLEQANPGPALVAVPLAQEDVPQIEDARPGPSAQAQRPEQQPYVRALITGVLDLFPDVQEAYVAELILKNNVKDLNVVCNLLLENPEYADRENAGDAVAATSILLQPGDSEPEVTEDLFDYSKLTTVGSEVVMQAADLLMADFRMLSCQDIKWALNALKGHYAITRKALCEALKKWQESGDLGKKRRSRTSSERCFIDFHFEHGSLKLDRRMFFLENNRRYCRTYSNLEASVQKELSFYQQKAKEWAEHEDFLLALQVNEDEYKKDGQLIECGCCFGEFAFEKMTQCSDGHLFCKDCLVKYAQEAVFGAGQSELSCMEGGCPCSYPSCELEKVLPENILLRYNERQAEEAVAATCADELVRCPFCNFPALLDKDMSLFSCPNPRCRKESCRKCHVLWKQHKGKTCEQVLEQDEIRMRVVFEERMTAARVRKCIKCGTGLVKSEGCNRMSCRCGGFMCYLCREPITGYNHFCQHARSPGAPCRHCHKCSLWTDPTQDDERIIQEIQKEGEAELNKKCAGKRVGPPPEAITETKRPCVGPPPENPPIPNPAAPPQPQAVQAPLFVPPRGRFPPPPPPQGQMFHQILIPPAPYVPLLQHLPPMNNNNQHEHNPPFNQRHRNMDLPMHYGPPPYFYRR
ncbi:E3 ubiquitin-protein ligase RNF216 [Oryzias melastigma]|uniref:E3 ubiquitin-protein ligase RNF216 n=1 Tax=Oryzias melastigma TaxID=30732 RepID=A0A834C477_ORYME|nr:E3 ubiquitin-protein ligase RNF216 [Oryzias melastigma]